MRTKILMFLSLIFLLNFIITEEAISAQLSIINQEHPSEHSYLSTPKKVYTAEGWSYKFNADNVANYPYEIYLPNENNPENYRIHTSYTKNTDACASCHATHTAVGPSLVQWYSNYETCLACHDGTVSTTYNVVEGLIPRSNQWTSGGVFGTGKEDYLSYHNVTGGVMIGAAPNSDVTATGTKFDMPMGCESCHSPHGMGGNGRILTPDPNGIQLQKEDNYKNYQLVQIGSDAESSSTIFAAYPKDDLGAFNLSADPYYMLKGYPYPLKIYADSVELNNIKVDNASGYSKVYIPDSLVTGAITADFIPSLRVRMRVQNYLAIDSQGHTVNEMVYYRDGSEAFCRACHNSFGSTHNDSGEDDLTDYAHKHPVGMSVDAARIEMNYESEVYSDMLKDKFEDNNTVVCLTCHAPHGVDQEYWIRSVGFGSNNPSDMAFSSCLKRAPNGSLCLVCHPWDIANQGYLPNSGQEGTYTEIQTTVLNPLGDQPLTFGNYVGANAENCSGKCHHTPIADGWETTTHKLTLADNSAINPFALAELATNTGLQNISDVVYVIGANKTQRYIYLDSGTLKVAKNEFDVQTGTWITKPEVAEFVNKCAGCHVTGLNVDDKTWTDNGVACEACHGAASKHIQFPKSRNITNPRYLEIKDQTDLCAQCHALGQSQTEGIYRPYPVGYVPHQAALLSAVYHDDFQLSNFFTIYNANDYPGNFFAGTNPSGTIDSYYPAQQFNDFVQSKHYQSNIISCTTCHSSHITNWKNQMLKGTYEQICGSCHDQALNINDVMPQRITYPGSENYTLSVHTFSKPHDSSNTQGGGLTLDIH